MSSVHTMHPSVVIDDTFSELERDQIVLGLAAWEIAVPEIRFQYGWGSETIHIVRRNFKECPGPNNPEVIPAAAAQWWDGFVSTICVDMAYSDSRLQSMIQHEVGHSFGMTHTTDVSVMAIPYSRVSDKIQHRDISVMRSLWSI